MLVGGSDVVSRPDIREGFFRYPELLGEKPALPGPEREAATHPQRIGEKPRAAGGQRICYPSGMERVELEFRPTLDRPVAVLAFAGWNDAASAATGAARFVVGRSGARRFATIPAEPYFDFRANRPQVRIRPNGSREIAWPAFEMYASQGSSGRDLVIGVGTEPNLRWRTFSRLVADVLTDLDVGLVITLGALLSDAPHTRPVRITGSAPDPETAAKLGLSTSRYEGPTGIVGTINDALRQRGLTTASFWANCPHYVSTNQNPPATSALVSRLGTLVGTRFDLSELERASERFVREVNSAVAGNPEIAAYVKRLEAAADDASSEPDTEMPPASEDLFADIERFLRGDNPGRGT